GRAVCHDVGASHQAQHPLQETRAMIRNTFATKVGILAIALVSLPSLLAAQPIPGIGPVGEIVKAPGDFEFTEGPAWDGKGNLYFSDVQGNKLYKIDSDNKLSVLLDPS